MSGNRAHPTSTPSLGEKVALLKQAHTYRDAPARVDTIETHMSWVFLTDMHAYKLKKPVRYDYLDFSTLAAREHYCREELRLNQRLAPGVYLGVVALVLDASGHLRLEGLGGAVEWLVKMRRLPAHRMLTYLIHANELNRTDIERVAEILIAFYSESTSISMSGGEYRARFCDEIDLDWRALSAPQYALPEHLLAHIHRTLTNVLVSQPEMFDRRANMRRIVEGHGDLRPEHICLVEPPVIFDRLEFNRDFRLTDIVDELCFLSMECRRLGAPFVGDILLRSYVDATGDATPASLQNFYMAQKAYTRARLAALHTTELDRDAWPRWLDRAGRYLRLADALCDRL